MKRLIGLMIGMWLVCFVSFGYAGMVSIQDQNGAPRGIKLADDDSQDVNLQDQTTRPLALRLSFITDLTPELASIPVVGTYDITLVAGHSVIAGESFTLIYNEAGVEHGQHFMTSEVLSVSTNILTMDEPVPYPFPVDSIAYTSTQNMNVNGSVVGGGTKIFQLTNAYSESADLTQLIFHITDATDMDDSLFGGMTALTRGFVFRKAFAGNGHYENHFNVKSNGEFGELTGPEFKAYDSKAPAGVYGYTLKVNYSGQSNYGVVIRLEPGDSIQFLIQDDLTPLLTFTGMAIGHFTN